MLRIGLTGPSGGGKGYVSALLEERGIPCLDTDKVVHGLYADRDFTILLSRTLGEDLADRNGCADRRKLGALVFNDPEKMRLLLALVYPRVRSRCLAFFEDCAENGAQAAAVDAPQLFEAGMEKDFDLILAIDAPKALRLKRVTARDGITRKEALLRFSHQMSGREYRRRAHHTLVNDGIRDLPAQLDALLARAGVYTQERASDRQ